MINSGCVEVPEQTNRSEQGIQLLSDSVAKESDTGNVSLSDTEENTDLSASSDSGESLNTPPLSIVEVTPNPHGDVQTHIPMYQNLYNQAVVSPETVLIPIYSLKDREFMMSGMAFQYSVTTLPTYIILDFMPKMDTISKVFDKRTGDKEGTVQLDITRPNPDSWLEMKVYDTKTGEIVTIEGFGKIYTEDLEKTIVIRESGDYQFDFWGSFINATITIKIPLDKATAEQYQAALQAEAESSGLLGFYYLILQDLPVGWYQTGDPEHTTSFYKSTFTNPASGSRFNQVLQELPSVNEADSVYTAMYEEIKHLTPRTISIGQDGVSYDSVRKSGIIFKKGRVVVQLDSFSYPPVSVSELKDYATIIEGRIRNENSGS